MSKKKNNKQLNTDDNNFWLQYAQQLENSKPMERKWITHETHDYVIDDGEDKNADINMTILYTKEQATPKSKRLLFLVYKFIGFLKSLKNSIIKKKHFFTCKYAKSILTPANITIMFSKKIVLLESESGEKIWIIINPANEDILVTIKFKFYETQMWLRKNTIMGWTE
ncbi:MAG TPA: hypothetical protein PLH80_07790 [Spirochaetota bacterium]|nr:hypothetical protein [Spirochaetota bacterium]HOF13817.1 hypothetical protein [Spirochaetota bacterium]HOM88493.1 hypothetical protein [Spirochaetota bacterium]HOT20259.1 hypothetical protein [Spirochaetota bacterium]HPK44789.1 hypothetical protein [Spirochaetota bacterium]